MSGKKAMPLFANKEDSNFREALKLYDAKQYKKALKLVETNLKKNSNHAESLALKGCINYYTDNKSEAEPYIVKATSKAPGNYLVNHLAGIYYRSVENYPEAAKWLKLANDNGSPNKPILRDLAVMQTQIRDYKNLVASREAFLEHQPGYRANWTATAVAHHLNRDYANAVKTLTKIEGIIKEHLTDADRYEHSECALYKVGIIGEAGNYKSALEALDNDEDIIKDKLSLLEYRAKYSLLSGDLASSAKYYRQLLQRNPDNYHYYILLELALKTNEKSENFRSKLYEKLSKFYPKSDPPKFIPLLFLSSNNPVFAEKVKDYVTSQLKRGVPSTFINIKPLMKNSAKAKIIESIVFEFLEHAPAENPTIKLWTYYFLSQFYLDSEDLSNAEKYIDLAIDHSPTLVELYIIKARIEKHKGDFVKAADVMSEGCDLDLQDRFVNSKSTKYFLRANKVEIAIDTISKFTKVGSDSVNGLPDLHSMQVNWVLVESAEAYARLYHQAKKEYQEFLDKANQSGVEATQDESALEEEKKLKNELQENVSNFKGLAAKRFNAVIKNFETFFNDQFDFHSYCMRRGTPRDYIDTIKWEDQLHSTPIYVRAIKGISDIYFDIDEEKKINKDVDNIEINKKSKKTKKTKTQVNKRKAELIKQVSSAEIDEDPLGVKLLEQISEGNTIEKLSALIKPLSEEAKDYITTSELLFKLHLAEGKYVLALQSLKSFNKLVDPNNRKLTMVGDKVIELHLRANKDTNAPPAIIKVVGKALVSSFPDFDESNPEQILKIYKN